MSHKTPNRVLEVSTSTGTGDFTLGGAVPSYVTFASEMANGDTCHYMILEVDTTGRSTGAYELGRGTFGTGGVLKRTAVIESSNGNALVAFAAGTKQVGCTVLAPNVDAVRADWLAALGAVAASGSTMTGALNFAPTVSIAAAATVDLGAALSNSIYVTGSIGPITSFGTAPIGSRRYLRFANTPTITHNPVSLICPGSQSIVAESGDSMELESLGSGGWIVARYTRFANTPVPSVNTGPAIARSATSDAVLALLGISGQTSFRNMFINGDMRINQEVAGGLTASGSYPVDGWVVGNVSARLTAQQQVTTSFPGFNTSLRVTVTATGSPSAGDVNSLLQGIEGTTIARLGWGSAGAIGIWISGYFRSSVAGTYALSVRNNALNRSYVTPLVINNANTTEYKSFFIPGDTSGTWATGTAACLYVSIAVGAGTTNQTATTNAWQAGNFVGITGQTQLIATALATFEMTGMQCETLYLSQFEQLPFEINLARCKRYWQSSYVYGTAAGSADQLDAFKAIGINANDVIVMSPFPVEMRAIPSCVSYNSVTGVASNLYYIAAGSHIGLSGGLSAGTRSLYACAAAGSITVGGIYAFNYTANARI